MSFVSRSTARHTMPYACMVQHPQGGHEGIDGAESVAGCGRFWSSSALCTKGRMSCNSCCVGIDQTDKTMLMPAWCVRAFPRWESHPFAQLLFEVVPCVHVGVHMLVLARHLPPPARVEAVEVDRVEKLKIKNSLTMHGACCMCALVSCQWPRVV
jgi:hypothetical protein